MLRYGPSEDMMAHKTPKPRKKAPSDLSLKKAHDDKVKGGKKATRELEIAQAQIEAMKGEL